MDLRKKCRRPRSRSNVEKNEVKVLAATNKRWHCKINYVSKEKSENWEG